MEPTFKPEVYIAPQSSPKKKIIIIFSACAAITLIGVLFYLGYQKGFFDKLVKRNQPKIVVARPSIKAPAYVDPQSQNGPFICPVTKELCDNFRNYEEGTFSAQLTKITPLLAIFDGLAEYLETTHNNKDGSKETYTTVLLINESRGLLATYSYKGKVAPQRLVKEGDVLDNALPEPIQNLNGKSFMIEILRANNQGTHKIPLIKNHFVKNIRR